jgi:type VI protein secretion system component VasK
MMPIPIILYSGVYGSGNIWIDIAYSFFAIPILIWAIYELWSIYKEEREDRKFEREQKKEKKRRDKIEKEIDKDLGQKYL